MQTIKNIVGTTLEDLHIIAPQREGDKHWSPEVPKELSDILPDLGDRRVHTTSPVSKYIDPESDSIWILDNTAYRIQDDEQPSTTAQATKQLAVDAAKSLKLHPAAKWRVEYVAAYFSKKVKPDPAVAVSGISKKTGMQDEESLRTIEERIEPFLMPILPYHMVDVTIDGHEIQTLGPGSSFGISSTVNHLAIDATAGQQVMTTANHPHAEDFVLPSSTFFAEPTGWGVISDIDDTIKVTMTSSVDGILRSTFVDIPKPVDGMPELYAHIRDVLSNPSFFYVSASPYNLYPFLRRFRKAHYPDGTIVLRDASWQNLGGFITSLRLGVQDYKVDRMVKIHSWLPGRSFICFGDSTQKDPESYGEIARRFPGWVKGIFIRKVVNVSEVDFDQEINNSDERFATAFQGLDASMWHVFSEPEEARAKIDELLKAS